MPTTRHTPMIQIRQDAETGVVFAHLSCDGDDFGCLATLHPTLADDPKCFAAWKMLLQTHLMEFLKTIPGVTITGFAEVPVHDMN